MAAILWLSFICAARSEDALWLTPLLSMDDSSIAQRLPADPRPCPSEAGPRPLRVGPDQSPGGESWGGVALMAPLA